MSWQEKARPNSPILRKTVQNIQHHAVCRKVEDAGGQLTPFSGKRLPRPVTADTTSAGPEQTQAGIDLHKNYPPVYL